METCPRCGDLVTDATRALRGLSFCRTCPDVTMPPVKVAAYEAPRSIGLINARAMALALPLGVAASVWCVRASLLEGVPRATIALLAIMCLCGAALVGLVTSVVLERGRRDRAWRAALREKHG